MGDVLVRVNDGPVMSPASWFDSPRSKRQRRKTEHRIVRKRASKAKTVKLTFKRKEQVLTPSVNDLRKQYAASVVSASGRICRSQSFLFSISLFDAGDGKNDTFAYYRDSALDFVQNCLEQFPGCRIYMHVNDLVSQETLDKFSRLFREKERFRVFCYEFNVNKAGTCWLVNAMRYRILWEYAGPETVVVCDIHDDFKLLSRQVLELMCYLEQLKKQVAITFWESDDDDCLSSVSLPLNGHYHIDGGVCLWRKGPSRTQARKRGSFVDYCCSMVADAYAIPRGIDEMFVDAFLGRTGIHEKHALYLIHKHKIVASAPKKQEVVDFAKLNCGKLKALCLLEGLRHSGNKSVLVERLKHQSWLRELNLLSTKKLRLKCKVLNIAATGPRKILLGRLSDVKNHDQRHAGQVKPKVVKLDIGSKTKTKVSCGDLIYVCHEKEKYCYTRQNEDFSNRQASSESSESDSKEEEDASAQESEELTTGNGSSCVLVTSDGK